MRSDAFEIAGLKLYRAHDMPGLLDIDDPRP